MNSAFREAARRVWEENVKERYMYRGMCLEDLGDALDPAADPFESIRPSLSRLIDRLGRQVVNGFHFTVYEGYSGLSFDLKDILAWSKHDLHHPGIDFTSIRHSALGYAQNHHGSQLKQNFKYITDYLPLLKNDPILRAGMTAEDWSTVEEVNEGISARETGCTKIVIWVRRTCAAFEAQSQCLPVGSLDHFVAGLQAAIGRERLPFTAGAIERVLPPEGQEFCVRAQRVIRRKEVEKIEEVGPGPWRPGNAAR